MAADLLTGLGSSIKRLFSPRGKDELADKTTRLKPDSSLSPESTKRIKNLVQKYYQQGSYEKAPFNRKWARNTLLFQGYHDLEWSQTQHAWEATDDYNEFAYPNNLYRAKILDAVNLYTKHAPEFRFTPTADDLESQAIAIAAQNALEVVKKNVQYDRLRAIEAEHLHLYGNSFRYSYYSVDPRFGTASEPQYEVQEIDMGDGQPIQVPVQTGVLEYPRGREVTEVVNPIEVVARTASPLLFDSPYLIRSRFVDRRRLEAAYNIKLDRAGTEENEYTHYLRTIQDTTGDPLEPSGWYSRTLNEDNCLLHQAWIRPSLYYDDPGLVKRFPDGIYAEVTGDQLLSTRNEAIEDHWVHFEFIHVPGRLWGDGDDDMIPKQLQLDATEQMVTKNISFNSVPLTAVDKNRVDPDKITNNPEDVVVVKNLGGRPVQDAIARIPGMNLSQEVYVWRQALVDDMDRHSRVFGSAIGQPQQGVDTLGGQQMFANRTESNQSPMLLTYKAGNEQWASQMLKIVAENWLDERVRSVMGINGNYEFQKLRGAALDPDRVQIEARIVPTDYAQQQMFMQATSVGLLNPMDPRVQRKALELFGLPTELDSFYTDARVQWKEIERMKGGEQVQAVPFVHNDDIHILVCQQFLNSDEAESNPELAAVVYEHLLHHIKNKFVMAQMMAPLAQGQPPEGGDKPPGQKSSPERPEQKQARQKRAIKGQTARPNKPQPSSGNQSNRKSV